MSKNSKDVQLHRCLWIAQTLLYNRKGMSYEEMMEDWRNSMFNDFDEEIIPKRTFLEYRRKTESLFHITISYDARKNIFFIVDPEEIYNDEFLYRMISGFAANLLLENGKEMDDRVMTERIPSGEKFFLDVMNAIKKQKRVRVIYQKFSDSEPKSQLLEPYFLKLYRRRWYMVAKIPDVDGLRVYSLDRIKDLTLLDETFKCPKNVDVRAFFFDCFGIEHNLTDYETEDIKLKVYNDHHKCQYLRTLPLHHSQKELERHEDFSIFQITVYPTYDFMQEILSLGDEVEVLEPQWVRDEFKKKITAMLKRYDTN